MKTCSAFPLMSCLSVLLLAGASGSAPLRGEDLTPQVLQLLESKCKECHHPDTNDDFPYLHAGVTVEELIGDESLVPGSPEESSILERVVMEADARKRMPKSRGAEGDESYRPPLSGEEQNLLRDWIAQMGSAKPAVTMTGAPDGGAAGADDSPGSAAPDGTAAGTGEEAEEGEKPLSEENLSASLAADPGTLPSGVSLDEKVHWIFEEHCSKCHTGQNDPELHGTVNLAMFFSEREADGTRLRAEGILELVDRAADAEGRMPKSRGTPGDRGYRPPLNEEEKDVIRKWLEAGKPKEVQRDFISNHEVIEAIFRDLSEAGESSRRFYRYLTLTNLHNAIDGEGNALHADLNPHRAAVSKLINSLSMNGKVTRPRAIDEDETVYRIDLRDYNWYPEDWERVVYYYPYGILGIDRQKEQLIERYTGSKMAYLRGDWFTFAAAQPPLYDQIMDKLLGFTVESEDDDVLSKLEHALGVNRVENLQAGRAMRAGFQFSGVSEANRLIERHEIGTHQGAYWVSYDFTPLSAKRTQDLKFAPLGPKDAHLTDDEDHIFDHDGGEMIYSLPNGLQGYMLTTNEGKRLDRAPIEIVQDANRQDNVILNGISCIACHDKGIRPAIRVADPALRTLENMTDEVRPLVEAAGILDFKEKNLLERLYPEPEVLQAAVKEDFERFAQAEAEATGGMAGSTEPVVGLYNEFRGPVTSHKLASEFGMKLEELIDLLKRESHQSEVLSVITSSLERGLPVRRENLLREYISVVYALGYELMAFEPLGYEDFGGESYADLIKQSDQFLAAFGSGGKTFASTKNALLTGSAASEALAHESVLLHGGGKLRLSIQPVLKVGDRANLEVVATQDAHLRIFHFSSDKHVTELFPGTSGRGTLRPKNRKLSVNWETTAPGGAEHIIVYSSQSEIKNLATGVDAGEFVVYSRDSVFSTRGIPKAVRVTEVSDSTGAPAQITEARIGYLLKD